MAKIPNIKISFGHYREVYFKCIIGGSCCFWAVNIGVFLTPHDIKRFYRSHVGMLNVPKTSAVKGILATKSFAKEIYSCIFQGSAPGECSIYPSRPFECRLYPLILDVSVDGYLQFHLEHCDGVSFRDNGGINLVRDIDKFLERYLDASDINYLTSVSLERLIRNKPTRIRIVGDTYGTWREREMMWSKIISKVVVEQDIFRLPVTILSAYRELRNRYIRAKPFATRRYSLFNIKDRMLIHPFFGYVGAEKDKTPEVEKEVSARLKDYVVAFYKRERIYGFIRHYSIDMDKEIEIITNALEDILLFLKTHEKITIHELDRALALIDQFLEFYAEKAHPIDQKMLSVF